MIRDVNTLSITGTCLLAAFCMLSSACKDSEAEQMYTQNTLEANAKLKQEISRLKKDMSTADNTAPDTLEQIAAQKEQQLASIRSEESAILKECVELCEEWDQCNYRRAELNAATEELRAVFEKEMEAARKAKANLSRYNEYYNN